jgi:hypothetical protein
MATYTTNSRGQRQYRPGTSVTVSTSGLQSSVAAARGRIGILYEASKGGQPKVPRTVTSSGELLNILPESLATLWSKILFNPGKPGSSPKRTIGGAASVTLCRVNPAEQAEITLPNADGDALVIKAADWGLYGNEIQAKIETGVLDVTKKKFFAKYGDDVYSVEGGNLPIISLNYTSPGSTPPAGWAITAMDAVIDPNAADDAVAVGVSYGFTGPAGAAIDPRGWMAFDGQITIAIDAQTAGAARTFVITGVRKDTGANDSESVVVASGGNTTSTKSWSEIASIDPDDALEGDATYTGYAFALIQSSALGASVYPTISSVIERINQKTARGFLAAALSARTDFIVADMDKYTSTAITTTATFKANLFDLMDKINGNIDIVEAERATGATGVPINVGYTNLIGGLDGFASDSDWTEALAAMETAEVNEIVPWTTSASINALVLNHCETMTLEGKGERKCALAVPLATARGTSAGQLYALSLAVNSRLATMHCQGVKIYNENGVLTTYEPYATSLICASLEAGRNPDYGITWALVNNVLELVEKPGTSATDWTVQANVEELLEHGYELIEKTKQGFRVVAGNTSYHGTEPQYASRLAVENTLLATTTLREGTEGAVGQSTVVPLSILRETVRTILNQMVTNKVIVSWDTASLVLTDIGGEKVRVDVNVRIPVERKWIDIQISTTV